MKLLQSLFVSCGTRFKRGLVVIFEEHLDGSDVVALALSFSAELLGFLYSGPALLFLFGRRRRAERVIEARNRLRPKDHGAVRVGIEHVGERFVDPFPVERIEQRCRRVESFLSLWRARYGAAHLPQWSGLVVASRVRNAENRSGGTGCGNYR